MAHPKKWGQKVAKEIKRKGTEGTFTAAAKSGESTSAHVSRVLAPGSQASTKMKRKAQFIRNIAGYEQGGTVKETGPAMLHKGEYVVPSDLAKKYEEHEQLEDDIRDLLDEHEESHEDSLKPQNSVQRARCKQLGSNGMRGN